ncbi:MAG: CoA transferase [Actinomycetota bacterium]|nr:CoA transferase [Actinomycetota bacterium]
MVDGERSKGPLDGVVIADFSRVLAGPYATMLLGDLGAEIIKVEAPVGDETRSWKPPVYGDDATYYLSINRNKRSVVLDFSDEADLDRARELVRRADVMIENHKPGSLSKFGLDYASVKQINPEIIYASITGFGTEGAGALLPGYDLMVQAMSGLMSLTGNPDGEPMRAGVAVIDVMTGLHCVIGILAALYERDRGESRGNEGQWVSVSLLASALSGMVNQTGANAIANVVPFRMGNAHPSLYPYEPLAAKDQKIVIAVGNDGQFEKFVRAIGAEWLSSDDRFKDNNGRNVNRDELKKILEEYLAVKTAREWFDVLTKVGVPAGPINTVDGGVAFAEEIGIAPKVEVSYRGEMISTIRNPVTFTRTKPTYRSGPPLLGEHSAQIKEWLDGPDIPLD